MIELILVDGRADLFQWDTKRQVKTDIECDQIHFSNTTYTRTIDMDVVDGIADIPDELLQYGEKLHAWCFSGTYDNGYTKYKQIFDVEKRAKPAGYVFTPTEQKTLEQIQNQIGNLDELNTPEKENIVAAINSIPKNGGENGATFIPSVDVDGNLSWANDKGLENPEPVNLTDIAEERIVSEYAIRETIYIGLDGYCYSAEGITYPITNLAITTAEDLKKYNFVLIYEYESMEIYKSFVTLAATIDNYGGLSFSAAHYFCGEMDGERYLLTYGRLVGEAVNFTTVRTAGEYITEYYGTLSVDKTALLGDIETALDNIIAIQNTLIGGESE